MQPPLNMEIESSRSSSVPLLGGSNHFDVPRPPSIPKQKKPTTIKIVRNIKPPKISALSQNKKPMSPVVCDFCIMFPINTVFTEINSKTS